MSDMHEGDMADEIAEREFLLAPLSIILTEDYRYKGTIDEAVDTIREDIRKGWRMVAQTSPDTVREYYTRMIGEIV